LENNNLWVFLVIPKMPSVIILKPATKQVGALIHASTLWSLPARFPP